MVKRIVKRFLTKEKVKVNRQLLSYEDYFNSIEKIDDSKLDKDEVDKSLVEYNILRNLYTSIDYILQYLYKK